MSETRVDALIVGHTGQDGTLLREQLEATGRSWFGVSASGSGGVGVADRSGYDVADESAVAQAVAELKPRELYYLSAVHGGSSARGEVDLAGRYAREVTINSLGVVHHLEAVRRGSPDTRLVFASSSLVFAPTESPGDRITEETPFAPAEPYGAEKLLAGLACRDYRREHGLFVSVAYLFNHESIHRRDGYFSSQVVSGIRRILSGETDRFEVGNLDAIVDWSHAGDVVHGLQLALRHDEAQDYIVASGIPRTIRQFLDVAFDHAGLDLDAHLEVNPALLRRTNSCRIGDATRLREATGWQARISFEDMVRQLLDERP